MIQAIFIQSFYKEILDGRLHKLIYNINNNKATNIELFVFVDRFCLQQNVSRLLTEVYPSINIIAIDDSDTINPTTKIFHFLINFEPLKYQQILLLESDCILYKNFDEILNNDINRIFRNDWFMYGSTYKGNKWKDSNDTLKNNSNHINGVAVYNRTPECLNHLNSVFVNRGLEQISTNYDFAYYESLISTYSKRCIDSEYIINLSDPEDSDLSHEKIKPKAVIVHTKNKNYLQLKQDQPNISNNIPVFLHIPKCAGTYTEGMLKGAMTWYGTKKGWNRQSTSLWNICLRKILIKNAEGAIIFIKFVYDLNNQCVLFEKCFNKIDNYTYSIYLETYFKIQSTINWIVFAIAIEPNGIKFLQLDLLQLIYSQFRLKPNYFTIMREPFEKAKSTYMYLSNDLSLHEDTYGTIYSKNFKDYISSYELEDCWLIRELLSKSPDEELTPNDLSLTTNFLDTFLIIEDIENVDHALQKILFKCYNLDYYNMPKRFKQTVTLNSNNKKIFVAYKDLNQNQKKVFDDRTLYDHILYKRYCNKSVNFTEQRNEN